MSTPITIAAIIFITTKGVMYALKKREGIKITPARFYIGLIVFSILNLLVINQF